MPQPRKSSGPRQPNRPRASGNKIVGLRVLRGLYQQDLARLAGITPSYMAKIEREAQQPSPPVLRKLADALGVTIADLLADEEEPVRIPA